MKILVVRFRQIGDAILSAVICNTLKKSFPNAQIDYVVYDFVAPLFENHKYIDNVITLDKETRENPFSYFKFVWSVTREKYDVVIDIMSTPKSEFFTLLSGAKFKIGRAKKWRGYTYTHKITEPKDAKNKCHKFLKMLKPLEDAGYKINYSADYSLFITDEEKIMLRDRMEECGIDFSKKIIAFATTSRKPEKIYPREYMKELIKITMEKYPDFQMVFFYSPEEKENALNMKKELEEADTNGFTKRIFTNVATKSIRELAMLLKNCDMFMGNEGGPRHLAQALGISTFSIFKPGSKVQEWVPENEGALNTVNIAVVPMEYVEDGIITKEYYDSLTQEERYLLMTPERLIKRVDEFVKKAIL